MAEDGKIDKAGDKVSELSKGLHDERKRKRGRKKEKKEKKIFLKYFRDGKGIKRVKTTQETKVI